MGTWEFIISNPPFNDESHRRSPDKDRALAHVLPQDGLEKWISSAAKLLKPGGRLALILRPAGLSEALVALVPQFGAVSIKPVHPKMDQPAGRVLIVATRASKAALTILPGLVLHKADGRFTDEAEEILRGRTGIVL